MIHDAASEKLFADAASRQAAKIGVIASPFLAAARPNSNTFLGGGHETNKDPHEFAQTQCGNAALKRSRRPKHNRKQ
jgi:hypothetical protein